LRNIGIAVVPPGTCGIGASRHSITISGGGHTFPNASVNERLYVIQVAALPVSYLCDGTAGTLWRFSGYALQVGQFINPNAAPLSGAISIA